MGDIINTIMKVENMQEKDIAAVLDVGTSRISNWIHEFKGVKFNDELIMLFCWYIKLKDNETISDKKTFIEKMKKYQDIDVSNYLKKDNKSLQEIIEKFEKKYYDYKNPQTVNTGSPQELDDSQKEEQPQGLVQEDTEQSEDNIQEEEKGKSAEDSLNEEGKECFSQEEMPEEQVQDLIQEEDTEQSEDNIQDEKEGKSAEDSLNEVGEECFSQEETSEERGDNDQKTREQQFVDDNHEEGIGLKDVTTKDLRILAKKREREIGDLLDERTKLTVSKNKKMLKKNEKKLQKTIDEEIDILEKLTEYGDSEAMYGLAMIYNSNVYQNANKNDYFKWLLKCAETFNFISSVKKANKKKRKEDFALSALRGCGDYLNNLPEPSDEGEILTSAFNYIVCYIAEKTKYYPSIHIPTEREDFSIQRYLSKSANKPMDIKDTKINKYKYKEQYDKLLAKFEKESIHSDTRCEKLINIIKEEIEKYS